MSYLYYTGLLLLAVEAIGIGSYLLAIVVASVYAAFVDSGKY